MIGVEEKQKKYRKIVIFFTIFMILVFFAVISQVAGIIRTKSEIIHPVCQWKLNKSLITIFNPNLIKNEEGASKILKSFVGKNVNYSSYVYYDTCVGYIVELKSENTVIDKYIICKNGYLYKYDKICKEISLIEAVKSIPEKLGKVINTSKS